MCRPSEFQTGDILEIARDTDGVNRLVEVIGEHRGTYHGVDINAMIQVSFRSADVVELVGSDPYYDSDRRETDIFGNPL